MDNLFLSSYTYLSKVWLLIFLARFSYLFMIKCGCCNLLKAFIMMIDKICACFFYFMTFAVQQSYTVKSVSHWCFQSNLVSIKKFFYNFTCFITNRHFYVITLECISHPSSVYLEKTKLSAILNWVFDAPDFWGVFMILLRYGLFSSRYSCIHRIFFQSPLLSITINFKKNYYSLMVFNNVLFARKGP